MSTVILFKSVSLDGYVAGPNISPDAPMGEGGERLHEWLFTDPMAPSDADLLATLRARTAATVLGRRTFDVGLRHWGDVPWPGAAFVVTHERRPPLPQQNGTFTFLPGVPEAVRRAREAAADRAVVLMGATTARQALTADLVDEVVLTLVPITLRAGTRLFDDLPLELRPRTPIHSPAVTHLHYDVIR